MGEVNHFKARTDWLLQPAIILAIEEGCYSTGDRKTLHELNQQLVNKQANDNTKQQELENLDLQAMRPKEIGAVARAKLYLINRFSYSAYVSWFKQADYSVVGDKVKITGNNDFANDYINQNYISEISL